MPITDDQKRAILEQRDADVRESLEEGYFAKQRAIKQAVRQQEREEDALKSEDATKNEKGEKYWDVVKAMAENMKAKGFAGYNDWAAEMQSILGLAVQMALATLHDPINPLNIVPYKNEIVGAFVGVKDMVWDNTVGRGREFVEKKLTLKDDQIARVGFHASLDQNGQLQSNVYINGQSSTNTTVNQRFDAGIIDWARYHGYGNVGYENGAPVFRDDAGQKMTEQVFDSLKNDPDTGLEAFLTDRFNFNFEHRSSP